MASSQAAAAMVDNEVDEFMTQGGYNASEAPLVDQANDVPNRKRKLEQSNEAAKKPKVQENRAIFVSNLPLDTNENEIEEVFSKYGIIDQGADGNKRIKMYYKDDKFTGEALIVYFKQASIALAIQMMDDYWFRIEEQTNGTITVKEADYSYKRNTDSEQIVSKLTRKDKKASERNRADLNRKLAEWSDNEDEVKETFAPKKNKWAKVCIIKHAFTLDELEEDDAAYLDIKEDIRDEAGKYGDVTKVVLFDKEVDGIITVRFKEFESAEKFREACNGRGFAFRKLEVKIAEDRPKFKKSNRVEEKESSDDEKLE